MLPEPTNASDFRVLGAAYGALAMAEDYGWKALYCFHSKATVRKYEKLLGVSFRELVTPWKLRAIKNPYLRQYFEATNFWKSVNYEFPLRRE